ncbi:hypothetical protein EDF36_0482 [Rathayibacter sp. PhB152]|nr:hypothetical protein EDF36_0482 [Rathayibacter sp. PhB152]
MASRGVVLPRTRQSWDHLRMDQRNVVPTAVRAPEEDESRVETAYLLHSPENARRLLSAVASAHSGDTLERDLLEP